MIHHQIFRSPAPDEPMVLAVFSYRYDAHLVPDLIENIRPSVHGFVAWDDRGAAAALSDEPTRRARLVDSARALGASWLLTVDPDERLERACADHLPQLLAEGDRTLWLFTIRDMFGPSHYRVDGFWGGKSAVRLFPIAAAGNYQDMALHGRWIRAGTDHSRRHSGINLYHLRMASPARRRLRRDLYAAADPDRRFQSIGYDYLVDERGMVLEPIPERRGFYPPFVEDHGLWSADPGALGPISPDPYEVRLVRAAHGTRRRGRLDAHHVLDDLFRDSPQDNDLRLLSAQLACDAQAFDRALLQADAALDQRPDDLFPRLLRVRALIGLGRSDEAAFDIDRLRAAVPGSPVIARIADEAGRPTADFTASEAAWRRLAPPDSLIHEGARISRSDLATVVIGFRDQPGLTAAVQSLLDQEEVPEIVVVNSGGGAVAASLAPVLDQIRLITCNTPLQVGAARNIGVAASRAPFVSFLAGDCRALPGWVSGRLARHRAGMLTVSSAVVGEEGSGPVALAASRLHYATRHPRTDDRNVMHYGLSYARHVLTMCGFFPPGLTATEDTVLNRRASRIARPVWAPDVVTVHRDVTTLLALVQDERRRGRRRSAHAPCRSLLAEADPAHALLPALRRRLDLAHRLLADEPSLSASERRCVAATMWLAAQADRHGVAEGSADIRAAESLLAEAIAMAGPDKAALEKAEAAWMLDPQDNVKARHVGAMRRDTGHAEGAVSAFRSALALDPSDHASARALVALVEMRHGPKAALAEAEGCALAAPASWRLWDLAAECARAAQVPRWAVALGQIALAGAPDQPDAHARLSAHHAAVPDPLSATFRRLTSARLTAAALARRDPVAKGIQGG